MKLRFWPRTLVVQLIAVTAVAVVLSNIAVALWFERGNEQQNDAATTERILDRAVAVATTLKAIPPDTRQVVMRTMSFRGWFFNERHGTYTRGPMNEDEAQLASRLDGMLPDQDGLPPVMVRLRHFRATKVPAAPVNTTANPAGGRAQQGPPPGTYLPSGDSVQAIIPLDKNTQLNAVFFRNSPDWPVQIMVATIGAILLTAGGAAFIARRVVRPLSELTAAASVVAHGGNAPHVEEKGPDDVRNAAIAFNAMTEKVRRTLESQRHLLSAVGHDLRTPITAMRINLEFIEDDELREGLQKNLDELQDLTEAVLSAARGAGGETKRNVDLSALVESLCTDLDEIGEPVTWQLHQPAPISCRPNEIRRAVRNLVENAVAYGGKAEVRIADMPDGYEILVDDEGPGIPETDRQRVFEPFVRLESSRNEDTGGTGLGLTLVKAIVESHGGAVVLENRKAGGLRARVHLPRTSAVA